MTVFAYLIHCKIHFKVVKKTHAIFCDEKIQVNFVTFGVKIKS